MFVCVTCTVGGLNLPWLDQWLTTGDEVSMSELQHDMMHFMDQLYRDGKYDIFLKERDCYCVNK